MIVWRGVTWSEFRERCCSSIIAVQSDLGKMPYGSLIPSIRRMHSAYWR